MTKETKRQEASREAREDEAEQALQDDLDLEETEGDENDKERAMTSTKKHDEYNPGDEVVANIEGEDLDGVVRSVQLSKGLVDVQIYKRGHMKHGLTVALPPERLSTRGKKAASA
jgi:hypothetical protein